jgi:hypothetical protein
MNNKNLQQSYLTTEFLVVKLLFLLFIFIYFLKTTTTTTTIAATIIIVKFINRKVHGISILFKSIISYSFLKSDDD